MTILSPPISGIRVAPHKRVGADVHRSLSRAPEWPRLTQCEVRQIVRDILG